MLNKMEKVKMKQIKDEVKEIIDKVLLFFLSFLLFFIVVIETRSGSKTNE